MGNGSEHHPSIPLMAHTTVTYVNGRKVVHVHGRQHSRRASMGLRTRMAQPHSTKRVCVLNESECERLELHGESFPCHGNAKRSHTHYSRAHVEEMVDKGEMRWVGAGQNVATFVRGRTWKALPSGGMTVMQMVPGGALY